MIKPKEEIKILVRAINKVKESSLESRIDQRPIDEEIIRERKLRKGELLNIYDSKSLEKLQRDRYETAFYVGCKLRKKRVWKYKGDILPKKFQQEISNYMNAKFV